jgi:small conductance mechanosensitive channel
MNAAKTSSGSNGADAAPIELPQIDLEKIKDVNLKDLSTVPDALIHFGIDWGARLLVAILIIVAGWVIGNWLNRRIEGIKRLDSTLTNFLGNFFKYTIVSVSIITVIGLFGIPMASLLAVLGAAGLAIGLALQGTLANIASGVMLLILRPFNVGDYITFGNEGGTVKSLGLFGTELAMADNVYLFAPNSKIWGSEIRNYSRNMYRRQDITVGISYNDDINHAFDIIRDVLNGDERIIQDENYKAEVMVDNMGDFAINLIVRFWSKNSDYWSLRWDITKSVKEKLESSGITIPFPTRTVEFVGDGEISEKQKREIAAGA